MEEILKNLACFISRLVADRRSPTCVRKWMIYWNPSNWMHSTQETKLFDDLLFVHSCEYCLQLRPTQISN